MAVDTVFFITTRDADAVINRDAISFAIALAVNVPILVTLASGRSLRINAPFTSPGANEEPIVTLVDITALGGVIRVRLIIVITVTGVSTISVNTVGVSWAAGGTITLIYILTLIIHTIIAVEKSDSRETVGALAVIGSVPIVTLVIIH